MFPLNCFSVPISKELLASGGGILSWLFMPVFHTGIYAFGVMVLEVFLGGNTWSHLFLGGLHSLVAVVHSGSLAGMAAVRSLTWSGSDGQWGSQRRHAGVQLQWSSVPQDGCVKSAKNEESDRWLSFKLTAH